MEMIFAREAFDDIIGEAEALLRANYREIAWDGGELPLDIDYASYSALANLGKFVAYSARVAGTFVGYSAFFINTNLHCKGTLFAVNDMIYLKPEYRGRGEGARFLDYMIEDVSNLGAEVISFRVKPSPDWGELLERRGFSTTVTVWSRRVGG